MALRSCFTQIRKCLFLEPLVVVPHRLKSHGNLPQKRRPNRFVERHTDFIKLLCIALVKHERIQTTLERAKKLERYGNMLIELAIRKQAPPDLFTLENGFLLRPDEIAAKFTVKIIDNRRWKKRVMIPEALSEEEFVKQCREEAAKVLLQDESAINKLYGELADRYRGKYGGFVKITRIPNQPNKQYPWLAYVELQNNSLPPLPVLPEYSNGELKGRPRLYQEHELEHFNLTSESRQIVLDS